MSIFSKIAAVLLPKKRTTHDVEYAEFLKYKNASFLEFLKLKKQATGEKIVFNYDKETKNSKVIPPSDRPDAPFLVADYNKLVKDNLPLLEKEREAAEPKAPVASVTPPITLPQALYTALFDNANQLHKPVETPLAQFKPIHIDLKVQAKVGADSAGKETACEKPEPTTEQTPAQKNASNIENTLALIEKTSKLIDELKTGTSKEPDLKPEDPAENSSEDETAKNSRPKTYRVRGPRSKDPNVLGLNNTNMSMTAELFNKYFPAGTMGSNIVVNSNTDQLVITPSPEGRFKWAVSGNRVRIFYSDSKTGCRIRGLSTFKTKIPVELLVFSFENGSLIWSLAEEDYITVTSGSKAVQQKPPARKPKRVAQANTAPDGIDSSKEANNIIEEPKSAEQTVMDEIVNSPIKDNTIMSTPQDVKTAVKTVNPVSEPTPAATEKPAENTAELSNEDKIKKATQAGDVAHTPQEYLEKNLVNRETARALEQYKEGSRTVEHDAKKRYCISLKHPLLYTDMGHKHWSWAHSSRQALAFICAELCANRHTPLTPRAEVKQYIAKIYSNVFNSNDWVILDIKSKADLSKNKQKSVAQTELDFQPKKPESTLVIVVDSANPSFDDTIAKKTKQYQ